jgi:hypothetical protein
MTQMMMSLKNDDMDEAVMVGLVRLAGATEGRQN